LRCLESGGDLLQCGLFRALMHCCIVRECGVVPDNKKKLRFRGAQSRWAKNYIGR